MIPFEEAFELTMAAARQLESENVDITQACGRILAEDVASDMNMPPFNKSAMDGYTCRREDLANELAVLESIQAGVPPTRSVRVNECSKIMTGAMVPDGANCVIMVEFTEQPTPTTVRFTGEETRTNICYTGEDIKEGDIVATRGARLNPAHIALLASVGCIKPLVSRQPKVGIVATGTEIIEPGETPAVSQIRNSNSYQLAAQVTAAGAIPTYYGIAEDTEESTDTFVRKAMAENDVILLSGGVSMGDFDLVPGVLKKNGFDLRFEKVAMKPGSPTIFGVAANTYCFGLPGNPVSTYNVFEVLVRPFLGRLTGLDHDPLLLRLPLGKTITRKKTIRASWIPVNIDEEGRVAPVEYHGSAHVGALCRADGLICIPIGVRELKKGTFVDVRQV